MNTMPFEVLWRDVRFGVRTFKRSPGITVAVILTLMLGIGANTALFSVIYAVLFKPLPYRDPDRLIFVAERGLTDMVGAADYLQWRSNARSFESLVAFAPTDQTLTGNGDALQVRAVMFSGTLVQTFGVSPGIGRDFCKKKSSWHRVGPLGASR